jgi:carboxymethylenebutenolidase
LDERVNAGIPAYEAALKKNNVDYELYIYEGANHAFHNDTSEARYKEDAAKLAWQRTMDFFKKHLS